MQSMAGVPLDVISIIQGLVVIFVAAPAVIRWIYRIRSPVGSNCANPCWGNNRHPAVLSSHHSLRTAWKIT